MAPPELPEDSQTLWKFANKVTTISSYVYRELKHGTWYPITHVQNDYSSSQSPSDKKAHDKHCPITAKDKH